MTPIKGRIIAAALLALLMVGTVTANPEPLASVPNCWQNNPNWHTVRSMAVLSDRTVCVYGAEAVVPCQMTSPRGLSLKRAVIKPNGVVKCVYGGGE